MSSPTAPRDDEIVRFLVRHGRSAAGAARDGPCPGDEALARFAEGRTLPAERDPVERHVASCPDCQGLVAALAVPLEAEPRLRRPLGLLRPRAAAAFLVGAALLGAAAWLTLRRPRPIDEVLVASARDLAGARPDLFAGFQPLDRRERTGVARRTERGAWEPRPLHPAGAILETRPEFLWEPTPGAARARVLLSQRGTPVWTAPAPGPEPAEGAEPARLAYPAAEAPLEPGLAYEWEIAVEGPLGPVQVSRSFSVLATGERARFEESAREIEVRAPREARALLRAHLALRRGLLAEAERAARAALAERPDDPAARETLFHVLRLLGASEADRLEPAAKD
jgi:hypothetical protein